MKFKEGDRVVFADFELAKTWSKYNDSWGKAPFKYGTVSRCINEHVVVTFDDYNYINANKPHYMYEEELELESVFNSPLWEALR